MSRRAQAGLAKKAAVVISTVLVAAMCIAPTASGAENGPRLTVTQASQSSAAANLSKPVSPHAAKCVKNGGVFGLVSAGPARVSNASVKVYAKSSKGTYSRRLTTTGSARTNAAGGFNFTVKCLPKSFLVKVTGGTVAGVRSRQVFTALSDSNERGVIITPATSVVVQYMQRNNVDSKTAVKRVSKYLHVVKLGNRLMDLGSTTWHRNRGFSPALFLREAKKHGGVQKFSKLLAKKAAAKKRVTRSFRPSGYVAPKRTGFPKVGPEGTPRTAALVARAAKRSAQRSSASDVMDAVAGSMAYSATCAVLPPSPPSNMACASPSSSSAQEVSNELAAVGEALGVLQEEVVEIQSTLDVMEAQLTEIQNQLNQIQQQVSNQAQLTLAQAANTAQQEYQDAYEAAGITTIQAQVTEAYNDLLFLGSLTPNTTWTANSAATTNSELCLTMYSQYNVTSGTYAGQNPQATCTDFLSQTDAFRGANPAYYAEIFNAMAGTSGGPKDNLLAYTLQQSSTAGGYLPIAASLPTNNDCTDSNPTNCPAALTSVLSMYGQFGNLMSLAFTITAAGQEFQYGASTGQQTSCPNLTTSGTFPSTTSLSVSSACNTMQSGLFAAAMVNYEASQIAIPPTGAIADPRTNYIWWSYPLDLTGKTQGSGGYPFWPGAPAGTYASQINPLPMQEYTLVCTTGTTCVQPIWANPNTLDYTVYPLLPNSPAYSFFFASAAQNQSLLTNLLVTDETVAGTLAQIGFQGIGQTQYGMSWTNLGEDPAMTQYATQWQWNSTTAANSSCSTYPATSDYNFACMVNPKKTYLGIIAIMAQHSWNLNVATPPAPGSATECSQAGVNTQNNPYTAVYACQANTFGLMVDTAVTTGNVMSPFWTPSSTVLSGVPTGGVAAIPISAPTPVVATS